MRHAWAAIAAAGLAVPATAADIPDLSPSLRYEVRGQVPVTCSLNTALAGGAAEFRDPVNRQTNTARADTIELSFTVACNTPIAVRMASQSGGLASAARTSDPDFTSLIAYSAQLNLPGAANALACTSAAMSPAQAGCRGTVTQAVTEGEGAVAVTLAPDGKLLLAGNYADRLTVTLTPILGGSN